MKSKTIRAGKGKLNICRVRASSGICISTDTQEPGLDAWALLWPTLKAVREFGKACIQIADELEAEKKKC